MNERSASDSEAITWSMVAQLAYFANFSIPFGGLIATALIYALRKDTVPVARENERNALNFEITLAILNGVLLGAYLIAFFSIFASVFALNHAGKHAAHSGPPPWGMAVPFGFVGLYFVISAACAVLSCSPRARRGSDGPFATRSPSRSCGSARPRLARWFSL